MTRPLHFYSSQKNVSKRGLYNHLQTDSSSTGADGGEAAAEGQPGEGREFGSRDARRKRSAGQGAGQARARARPPKAADEGAPGSGRQLLPIH